MNWQEAFSKGSEVVLATVSQDGTPHANIVAPIGFFDGKLLIADCQMDTTRKNIERNKHVCLIGGYFRLKGKAELSSTGEHYDKCVMETPDYEVRNAILVTIDEVFDLDNMEPISPNCQREPYPQRPPRRS